MVRTTDYLLVQLQLGEGALPAWPLLAAALEQYPALPLAVHRIAHAPGAHSAYLYLRLPARAALDAAAVAPLAARLRPLCPQSQDIRISRLEKVFDAPGHSRAQTPAFHYVVEMDPDTGWMPEIARWYDTEHMPGLAAVPGCIHAMRFLNHDHGPLSLACYDLVSEQTLGSPPWLAVRGTAWSDITRPHFTNTRRTMFNVCH